MEMAVFSGRLSGRGGLHTVSPPVRATAFTAP